MGDEQQQQRGAVCRGPAEVTIVRVVTTTGRRKQGDKLASATNIEIWVKCDADEG